MRIAFASCSDPIALPKQSVWARIAAQRPDHLFLIGDQMYTDYAYFPFTLYFGNPATGKPAQYSDLDFAAHLYKRYAAQWRAMKDSGLWDAPNMKVHVIWDDHDFAWDNSHGAGRVDSSKPLHRQPVPASKQRVSRHLFRQFCTSLRASVYPANTLVTSQAIASLDEDLARPVFYSELPAAHATWGQIELAPDVRLLLTDGRSYRTAQDDTPCTALGAAQLAWIKDALLAEGVTLLTCGVTLNDWAPECLRHYEDYRELLDMVGRRPNARVLYLSGDVHYTDIGVSESPRMIQVVSSGAARPFGNWNPFRPSRGNFAVLDIGQRDIEVRLFEGQLRATPHRSAVIDRTSWQLQG